MATLAEIRAKLKEQEARPNIQTNRWRQCYPSIRES